MEDKMSNKSEKEALIYQSDERLELINKLILDYEKRLKELEDRLDLHIQDERERKLLHAL